jgi:hypothetical protein
MFKPLPLNPHFRCSVEAMKGHDLAISKAVMAMKLQLVTDAETFRKKKLIFRHDKHCYMCTVLT